MSKPYNDTTTAALLEDLDFLAEHHVGLTEAAHRVDYASADALDRWLRTHGHTDLVRRLLANEPHTTRTSSKWVA